MHAEEPQNGKEQPPSHHHELDHDGKQSGSIRPHLDVVVCFWVGQLLVKITTSI